MSYLLGIVLNVQLDQPIVHVTAPAGSAAFQIGGSTIHSAFLMYDDSKSKPSWEKWTIMQLKLERMMLSVTNEISMVGFKQFQHMNQTIFDKKGTTDVNWVEYVSWQLETSINFPQLGSLLYICHLTIFTH